MPRVVQGEGAQSLMAVPNALLTLAPFRSTLQISSSRRCEKNPTITADAIRTRRP